MARAVVRATQRRQVTQLDYELPITFGGHIALYYPEPVALASPKVEPVAPGSTLSVPASAETAEQTLVDVIVAKDAAGEIVGVALLLENPDFDPSAVVSWSNAQGVITPPTDSSPTLPT